MIGGGLSAALAALAAVRANNRVTLRSRRPLVVTKDFDVAEEWLDTRKTNRQRAEFLRTRMDKRRQAIDQAAPGGVVPRAYAEQLLHLARTSDRLELEVDEEIDHCQVRIGEGGAVYVNDRVFAQVILATGLVASPMCSPLYQQVQAEFDAKTVDDLPHLDTSLQWVDDEPLFVLGANAALELGPSGGNLLGAIRGAKIISNELHDLMWARCKTNARPVSASAFARVDDDAVDE